MFKTFPYFLQTYSFIARASVYTPLATRTFNSPNREKFDTYLDTLKPYDTQSSLWLMHLQRVNIYADVNEVTLLDDELSGLMNQYKAGTQITSQEAVTGENSIFEQNAEQYKNDDEGLDYVLRAYRPSPDYLPDGIIKFNS